MNWKAYEEVHFSANNIQRWVREGDEYVNRMTLEQMGEFQTKVRQQANRIAELEKRGKPVAWMFQGAFDISTYVSFEKPNPDIYPNPTPLYTAPQTKPLSDGVILNSIQHPRNDGYVPEELNSDSLEMVEINLPCSLTIDEIHNLFGITALNPTVTLTWEQCEKIARAIEERHGIK